MINPPRIIQFYDPITKHRVAWDLDFITDIQVSGSELCVRLVTGATYRVSCVSSTIAQLIWFAWRYGCFPREDTNDDLFVASLRAELKGDISMDYNTGSSNVKGLLINTNRLPKKLAA